MDNQLLLGLLFVTLSWGFMGTYAQSSTTMMTTVNATTLMNPASASANMANNATTSGTAVASSTNMTNNALTTTGIMVTSSTNMTNNALTMTGTMVTSSTNMTNNALTTTGTMVSSSTNMTNNALTMTGTMVTSSTNMTNNALTTTGTMVTSSTNMTSNTSMTTGTRVTSSTNNGMSGAGTTMTNTTGANNMSSITTTVLVSNTTLGTLNTANTPATPTVTGNNATTAAYNNTTVTTITSTATTMIPVGALLTPISNTNCGSTKLCAAVPSGCNPATGVGCYFISVQQQSGQLYNFELSGESSGYIAAGTSTSSNVNGTQQAYLCANNNGAVRFFTATITNLALNLTQLNVSNVKGAINSRKIQCTFAATLPDTAIRAAAYSLSISNGTYSPATGKFGNPFFLLFTNLLNLSDSTSNATNQISNGAYPATYQQPLIPALLVTVVMLTFSMM